MGSLTRWFNPTLPQTLQIAVFLLYADAVMGLIFGTIVSAMFGFFIGIAYLVACFLAGLGIANELKWGWTLGVAASVLGLAPYVLLLIDFGPSVVFSAGLVIGLMFSVAQFALLVHPRSREHQKIWFT